jgi:GT2 family glycosyltransferase
MQISSARSPMNAPTDNTSQPDRLTGGTAAVILNWNQAQLTLRSLASVQTQVDHVYIVDNGSQPSDRTQLQDGIDDDTTIIVNPTNAGYAAGCNRGVDGAIEAGFSTVLIMNNDAFADAGSIRPLLARLEAAPSVGAVGPVVVRHGTRKVLHAACSLNLRSGRPRWLQYEASLETLDKAPIVTEYLSGEAMLIRSEVIKSIKMFDERYFCYNEDADWSLRARRAGWRLEVIPESVFEHMVSVSSAGLAGAYYRARNRPLFLRLATGRGRLAALILALPAEFMWFAVLVRHGHIVIAFRGVVVGWLVGVMMRV